MHYISPWLYLMKQVLNPLVLSQPLVRSPIGSEKQVSLVAGGGEMVGTRNRGHILKLGCVFRIQKI